MTATAVLSTAAIVVVFFFIRDSEDAELPIVEQQPETVELLHDTDHPSVPVDEQEPKTQSVVDTVALVEPAVVTVDVAERGSGSGFIVDGSGVVVTSYHVIEGAEAARVILGNGESADVLGFLAVSPGKDLALLQIESPLEPLPSLSISGTVPSKGESVLAFGTPRGLVQSVSQGIVSAVRTGTEVSQILGERVYFDQIGFDTDVTWIQATAAMSGGNSGGPLVNVDGEVVGVITWGRADGQALNFAVAASDLLRLMNQTGGRVLPLSSLPAPRNQQVAKAPGDEEKSADASKERLAELQLQWEAKTSQMEELKQQEAVRAARLDKLEKSVEETLATARQARQAHQEQQQLSALGNQLDGLRKEVAEIQKEATRLRAAHSQVTAEAEAVTVSARRTVVRMNQVSAAAAEAETEIAARRAALSSGLIRDNIVVVNHHNRIRQLRQQFLSLQLDYNSLSTELRTLETKYTELSAKSRDLLNQINQQQNEHARRVDEFQRLQQQYDELVKITE